MLLKELDLKSLPIEALVALKDAIKLEIRNRRYTQFAERKLARFHQTHLSADCTYDEAYKKIIEINSQRTLALPTESRKNHFRDRTKYFPCVLGQDWSFLFPAIQKGGEKFYVYAHIDPRGKCTPIEGLKVVLYGDPFYIGKGSGNRAWDLKRNQGHGKRIKKIRDEGFPDSSITVIIAENLMEQDALILEAKLIYHFGSIYDESINGCLLNLADHVKPHFDEEMKKLPKRDAFDV